MTLAGFAGWRRALRRRKTAGDGMWFGHGTMTTRPIYTLAQYAIALGITARAARKGFGRHLRATGDEKQINGRLVRACAPSALPLLVRQRLAAKAATAQCRDADDWMARCTTPWQPVHPIAKWPPAALEKAARRREALAPILCGASTAASVSALTRAARRSFARLCPDQPQSERSVRRWLERARVRDRGRSEWERLELYLDDRSVRPPADPGQSASAREADILREALGLLDQPRAASLEDKGHLWVAAMEEIDGQVALGQSERAARAKALAVLAQSGVPLAHNRAALQRSLQRKRRAWRQSGGGSEALQDRRPATSGRFRAANLAEEDRHRLLARSLGCGGRLAQAYRELWDEGRLPASFYQTYTRDTCDKSRVPSGWSDAQFNRRLAMVKELPIQLGEEDLRRVACHHLPEGDPDCHELLVRYAQASRINLSAITETLRAARFLARKAGRAEATFADLQDAVAQIRAPMDWLLAADPAQLSADG